MNYFVKPEIFAKKPMATLVSSLESEGLYLQGTT